MSSSSGLRWTHLLMSAYSVLDRILLTMDCSTAAFGFGCTNAHCFLEEYAYSEESVET